MAKNQVLQDANDIFNHELKAPVSRSVFNLSHVHSFDADFGELLPFYYQYTLPNDSFNLSCIVKATALPLESPLYTALTIRTAFFFVPFYLLWHKFDKFLEGGRSGTLSSNITPPIIGDASTGVTFARGSLADYFGLPVGVAIPPEDCPDALPFFAYMRIWRDYYFNPDVQSDNDINVLFPEDDFDFQLSDGFQTELTGDPYVTDDSTTGTLALNEIRYRNWGRDYFTTAMPFPQRGDIVAMPISGSTDAPVTANGWRVYLNAERDRNQYGIDTNSYVSLGVTDNNPGNVFFGATNTVDGNKELRSFSPSDTARFVGSDAQGVKSKMSFLSANVSFAGASTFTIDDLRLATQLQLWLERNMRTRAEYTQFLRIHFNDSPIDLRLTKPYYIGGSSQQILVSEILQTSESTASSPLGSMGGTGKSFDNNFIGKFNSHEFGIIIGLMSIMPDCMYQTGLSREWSKRTRYDYYFPEFAQLSPQAILTKELYMSNNTSTNNTVFGYQGRFDELRHRRSYTSGALRDPSVQDFYSWTMAREINSAPTLTSSFVNSKGTVRHDAFTTGTTFKPFIVQTGVECRAVRPLPIQNQPMGLL